MWIKLSDHDYFNYENAYGSTDLKKALQSPAHVKVKQEQTAAMARGSLIHKVLLEKIPFVVMPEFNARTNQGKADKEAWLLENKNNLVATEDEVVILQQALASIKNHPQANKLINELEGVVEEAGILKCDNIFRRIKPDKRIASLSTVVDLKTTNDASGDLFARSATNYMYWLQADYYLDTANLIERNKDAYEIFVFVVVETKAPFGVRVFEVDKSGIELGREQYQKALKIVKNSVNNNDWNQYQKGIEILVPPAYAMYWEN